MRYFLAIAFVLYSSALSAQTFKTVNPDSIRINVADIINFWSAYDRLAGATNRADSLAIIDRHYLQVGTRGLTLYQHLSNSDAESFLKAIRTHPRLLQSIRKTTLAIPTYRPSIVEGARKLKQLYPPSVFPDLFFAIGKFEVAGNQTDDVLYIGAELNCLTKDSPRDELTNPYVEAAAGTFDRIDVVCLHEIVHAQQRLAPKTNLEAALVEGGAEYIAYRLTGKSTMQAVFDQVDPVLEQIIWQEFSQQLNKPIDARWFLAIGDPERKRPGMLGYLIGFRICEAYYNRATDKAAALKEITALTNHKDIYVQSGYNNR